MESICLIILLFKLNVGEKKKSVEIFKFICIVIGVKACKYFKKFKHCTSVFFFRWCYFLVSCKYAV